MKFQLTSKLAAVAVAIGLVVGCGATTSSSPATAIDDSVSVEAEDRLTPAPAPAASDELDAAVDALIDRLGPRAAFDAVVLALESGQTADAIIADPDAVAAP